MIIILNGEMFFMNKRQAKKKDNLIKMGKYYGFYHIPKYRELREIDRSYHEYCIRSYRTEKDTNCILINGEWVWF